tara:strand:+ start:156 stop:488 length:333 start_codon:yes stop_codon:yes gene_type:complete
MIGYRISTNEENDMKIINLNIAESTILETRDNLFAELVVSGSVYVNSHRVTMHELMEDMDAEGKDNIIAMMFVDCVEARDEAAEMLNNAFISEYDDEAIEKHIIDEATSL